MIPYNKTTQKCQGKAANGAALSALKKRNKKILCTFWSIDLIALFSKIGE